MKTKRQTNIKIICSTNQEEKKREKKEYVLYAAERQHNDLSLATNERYTQTKHK